MCFTQVDVTCQRLNRIVQEERKDAHRAVKHAIQLELRPAYDECAEQKGPGTFDRMKSIMSQSATHGKPQPKVFLQAKDRLISHWDSVMVVHLFLATVGQTDRHTDGHNGQETGKMSNRDTQNEHGSSRRIMHPV